MRRSLARSNRHHRKALQRLPLGVSSNFRYWRAEIGEWDPELGNPPIKADSDRVIHHGFYTCHSVALAAADKTLEILDKTDAVETITAHGAALPRGMPPRADRYNGGERP